MNISRADICESLQLFTVKGKYHTDLVGSILCELGFQPVDKRGNAYLYDSEVVPKIRLWFWKKYKGELQQKVVASGFSHNVIYDLDDLIKSVA